MSKGYEERKTYTFDVRGETFEVIGFNETYIDICETAKNGQEDTHVSAILTLVGGKWIMSEDGRYMFRHYRNEAHADAVVAFVNEHGTPK